MHCRCLVKERCKSEINSVGLCRHKDYNDQVEQKLRSAIQSITLLLSKTREAFELASSELEDIVSMGRLVGLKLTKKGVSIKARLNCRRVKKACLENNRTNQNRDFWFIYLNGIFNLQVKS
jgi:hypothetical protein